MNEEDSDSSEKEHDASQQRLDQARQDGDIPRSADLLAAASFAGFVAAFAGFGPWAFQTSGTAGMVLFDQSDSLSRLISTGASGPIGGLMLALALPVMATLMVPIAVVLLVIFATKGFVVAPGKLAPKLSRISPIATMKHKFGTEGLAEFGKSTVKLLLVSFILYKYFAYRAEDIFASVYLEPLLSTALLARLTVEFLSIIFLVTLVLGLPLATTPSPTAQPNVAQGNDGRIQGKRGRSAHEGRAAPAGARSGDKPDADGRRKGRCHRGEPYALCGCPALGPGARPGTSLRGERY
jgi:flagellar biosynthesis protein FlhB